MKQRLFFAAVTAAAVCLFACDGGLTVPYVSLTVQSTAVSDEDLAKLQAEEGALFAYSVPAFVTVDGKESNAARISLKQKRNFRFTIGCRTRSFLTFDRWTAEPASHARIFNPDSESTLVQLTGDCVITASFKRHHFLMNYTAGNVYAEPSGVNDDFLNELYVSLSEMETHGVDLSAYLYPAFDERGVLTANPDYPDYKSVLDFMAARGKFAGDGLDRNGDGRIHSFSDGLTAEILNRFFFGTYDESSGIYRGIYAGLLIFGDRISTLPEGKETTFEVRPGTGAGGTFISIGWEYSSALTPVSGGAAGDTQTVYRSSGDGVSVYRAVCDAVAIEVRAVKVPAGAVSAAADGRVRLADGTETEAALSTVSVNGGGSTVTVAENEKITLSVTTDPSETFAGWLYDDEAMVMLKNGEPAEMMPLFTDYLYQTNSRLVTAVFTVE